MTMEGEPFWDTHCVDCGHDMHPMDVCSAIVGGDQNGPDYCPCTLDYAALAAEYQRSRGRRDQREGPLGLDVGLLMEFDGSVCPACHHRAHDPGGCSECPRCELHTDEAAAFVLRYEPELLSSAPLDMAELGFADLLNLADALLTKYPPDTIVCSHDQRADIGARAVAGIADLVSSARLAATRTPKEADPNG